MGHNIRRVARCQTLKYTLNMRATSLKYLALSGLLILTSISLTRTTLEIIKSSKKLDTAAEEIAGLEQSKDELSKSIEYKSSNDYVEKVAREELNMVKPGEKVYVVKTTEDQPEREVVAGAASTLAKVKVGQKLSFADRAKNLKVWFRLYF